MFRWNRLSLQRVGRVAVACVAAGLMLSSSDLSAQKKDPKKKEFSEEKTLLTKSQLALKITYFPSEAGEDAPVAVLMHGKPGKGNRLVWKNFAAKLQAETEFAAITVDLSGHGESGSRTAKPAAGASKKNEPFKSAEYKLFVADDLEAVKKFIFEEHQKKKLNMSKLVLVGADFSTAVAVAFADFDWQKKRYDDAPVFANQTPRGEDVRGMILLSPEDQAPGLTVMQSLTRMKALEMPILIGVAKKDKYDKGSAKKMYEQVAPKKFPDPEKPYIYLVEYEGALRGTDLLDQPNQKLEINMVNFLQMHVAPMPIQWRDRRSRLERDDEADKGK